MLSCSKDEATNPNEQFKSSFKISIKNNSFKYNLNYFDINENLKTETFETFNNLTSPKIVETTFYDNLEFKIYNNSDATIYIDYSFKTPQSEKIKYDTEDDVLPGQTFILTLNPKIESPLKIVRVNGSF